MTGEVLSRITTDTPLILSVVGSSVSIALRNVLIFVGGLALMLLTSAKLTGLVLLIVPAVVVPILVLGRKLRVLSRENQDWIAASSGNASEALLSVQTVQAFTHEQMSSTAFSDVTEKSFDAARRRIWTRAVMTEIVIFLVFTGIVGVHWIGATDVRNGSITVGTLVQFVIYAIMVAGSVAALSEIIGELQRAAGATERLVELLHAEDTIQDPVSASTLSTPVRGEITFEDVHFAYPSRPGIAALDGVNLTIQPGETVAVVGPSGAGKTTIIHLIQRFYDPDKGCVLMDCVPVDELEREAMRRHIALVPQDPIIFASSARDNIRFGRPDATDAEIEQAARAAAAHDFITALPDGYDSYVGERGVMLSGGQRLRVALGPAHRGHTERRERLHRDDVRADARREALGEERPERLVLPLLHVPRGPVVEQAHAEHVVLSFGDRDGFAQLVAAPDDQPELKFVIEQFAGPEARRAALFCGRELTARSADRPAAGHDG